MKIVKLIIELVLMILCFICGMKYQRILTNMNNEVIGIINEEQADIDTQTGISGDINNDVSTLESNEVNQIVENVNNIDVNVMDSGNNIENIANNNEISNEPVTLENKNEERVVIELNNDVSVDVSTSDNNDTEITEDSANISNMNNSDFEMPVIVEKPVDSNAIDIENDINNTEN